MKTAADSLSRGNLRRLFWDVDLSVVDLDDYPEWTLERVLEFGNFDDIQLLIRHFGKAALLDLVAGARFSSRRTMCFWRSVLAYEGRSCTRKFSREIAWNC